MVLAFGMGTAEGGIASRSAISESEFSMITPLDNSLTSAAGFRLNRNQRDEQDSLRKLSTGKKINSGKDGPAALIAAEQLSAEIEALEAESRALDRADANANIADGNVSQLSSMIREMKGLVVASANSGALSPEEVAANQMQMDSLASSIERFTGDAISSLDGFNAQGSGNAELEAKLNAARTAAESVKSGGANDLSSGNFEAATTALDGAITDVASVGGSIGAYQKNTLDPQRRSNQVALANLADSRSRIADTNYAVETANRTRSDILSQASVQVLKITQNQIGSVLDLLG